MLVWLIPALPLAGFLLLALAGKRMPRAAVAAVGSGSVGLAMLAAAAVAVTFLLSPPPGNAVTVTLWQWILAGNFTAAVAFSVDALSLVMVLVVTFVGFLIHLYSTRFMARDDGYARFFACMNLFVASMLILVLADNLVLLYLGWEGVGLCSYLLIGFWYTDPANGRAARKAFIVTRVGDVALAVGLFLISTSLGTLNVREIAAKAASVWPVASAAATAAAMLLLGGAVGKSAQLPLHTWLPDAMAGPSPVSALIHAATMVTAGVYLIARMNAIFVLAPAAQTAVAIVGAAGILVAGLAATAQRDLKRILAYSTMSQLGYMFLALGVGAWSAAVFHLFTHAFFKSLLFLAGGLVIVAMEEEHDIFAMGGLARKVPLIFWTFLIGALSLTSLPPATAGFSSKDAILALTWAAPGGKVLWALAEAGVLVTSIYTFRLVFAVFLGRQRGQELTSKGLGAPHHDARRIGFAQAAPLVILAALCVGAGFLDLPRTLGGFPFFTRFLETALPPSGTGPSVGVEGVLQILSEAAALLGIPIAWLLARSTPDRRGAAGAVSGFLRAGLGFDWIYDRLIVRPFAWLARANASDVADALPRGVGGLAMRASGLIRRSQNGRIRWYAAGLAAGAAIIVAVVVLL